MHSLQTQSDRVALSPLACRPRSWRPPCFCCSKCCPCPFPCLCPRPFRVPRRLLSRPGDALFRLIRPGTRSRSLTGPVSSLTGLIPSSPVPSSSGMTRGWWDISPAFVPRGPEPPCLPWPLLEPRPCRPWGGRWRVLLWPCLLLPRGAPGSVLCDRAKEANRNTSSRHCG